jgi:hypothetical protein
MTCLNCSTEFLGHYCNECGQKVVDGRYTVKTMFSELFFSVFHVEKKGLPHTIRRLTVAPGEAIKGVLNGKRLTLYPAFKYLVLMGAIVIVFSLRYRFFHNEITKVGNGMDSGLTSFFPMEYHAFLENFFRFAEDQATLLNIVAIPIFAFFSWAFLSGRYYNFGENLIINTFITAQQLFFILPLAPVLEFFPGSRQVVIGVYTFVIVLYNIWVYNQLYYGNKFGVLAKSILVVVAAYVYQLPFNLLIFYLYENLIHHHMNWIPHVYDNLVR